MDELQLGDKAIRGAGTLGELTQTAAETPEGAMDLLLSEISTIIGFLTLLGGLFFTLYFVIAAFDWLRSGGDKAKVEKAQQKMINSAIGLLIMIVAIGIVGIVGGVFGIEILNPTATFVDLVTNRGK
jgi:hypothetical protein